MPAQARLVADRIGGLCLAAGRSSRMGAGHNKLTMPIDGRPLVAWSIDAMGEAGLGSIRVVTGFESAAVQGALSGRDCIFYNHEDWKNGMGASLAFGAREMMSEIVRGEASWEGMLVCLGDLPGLSALIIEGLLAGISWDRLEEQIVIPTFDGRRGHPVFFGRRFWSALARLSGDEGAKGIIEAARDRVVEVEVGTDAIFVDLDTPEDIASWREGRGDDQ